MYNTHNNAQWKCGALWLGALFHIIYDICSKYVSYVGYEYYEYYNERTIFKAKIRRINRGCVTSTAVLTRRSKREIATMLQQRQTRYIFLFSVISCQVAWKATNIIIMIRETITINAIMDCYVLAIMTFEK